MFGRMTALLLRRPALSAMLVAVVVLVAASGVLRLSADFSVRSFFGRSDPEAQYLEQYQARWGGDDLLVVVVEATDGNLLQRARLDAMDALVDEIDAVPGVTRVMSLTRQPRANRGIAGIFIPIPLLATAPKDDADPRMEQWRKRLVADPAIVPSFLSPDGRYGSLLVALGVDGSDLQAVKPVVDRVAAVLEGRSGDGLRFHVAGVPAIRADILDVIVGDQIRFVPMAGAAMALLLALVFRSIHGVVIPGIAASVPLVMLLGLMGWTGQNFDLINQSMLVLVPAIAAANAIHLVSRYHEETRRLTAERGGEVTPEIRRQAIIDAADHIGVASLLTTLTTVVGFAALLRTDLPVLRGYGAYASLGVVLSYVSLLTVVPLLLLTVKSGARRVEHGDEGVLGAILRGAADLTIRHPKACLATAAAVAAVFAVFGTWVRVDTRVVNTYDEDHRVTVANRVLDEHMGGVLALEFDLTGAPGTFERPDVLAALTRVEAVAKGEPGVRATAGPATLLRGASVLLGGPGDVPADAESVRRLYKVLGTGGVLAGFVSDDRDHARLLIQTVDEGSVAFLALGDRLSGVFHQELAPLGVDAHLTGSSFVAYRGMSRVTEDLRSSLMMSFGIIGIVIGLLFRDPLLGALSLVPNLLPQVFGYGLMGLVGWTLEPAPAVVYTIAVGVSVDAAIHIIARFREERSTGRVADDAVRSAIYSSGRAVVISLLMLSFGFLVNVFSSAPATASFGKLGSVIILLGPPANILVLPALLKLGVGDRGR